MDSRIRAALYNFLLKHLTAYLRQLGAGDQVKATRVAGIPRLYGQGNTRKFAPRSSNLMVRPGQNVYIADLDGISLPLGDDPRIIPLPASYVSDDVIIASLVFLGSWQPVALISNVQFRAGRTTFPDYGEIELVSWVAIQNFNAPDEYYEDNLYYRGYYPWATDGGGGTAG